MIRPELIGWLRRWREALLAAAGAAAGLWIASLGGLVLAPAGLAVAGLSLVLGLQAVRRVRFAQAVGAPGLVEVDEGQIGYLGPTFGGFVALPDLVELRVVTLSGRAHWRLKQADGQAMLIPASASGAEKLFDAFAALPGIDMQRLVDGMAADRTADGLGALVWSRARKAVPALPRN